MPEDQFISIGESLGIDPPAGTPAETQESGTPPQEPTVTTPEPAPPPKSDGFADSFLNDVKQSNNEFSLPDNYQTMNDTERYNFMKDTIIKSTPITQSEDPFINSYQKAKENGVSPQDFIRQQNISETVKNMSDDQFLVEDLLRENGKSEANPGGWDRSTVEEYVNNMNEVDRFQRAKERKDSLMTNLDQESEKYRDDVRVKVREQAEKANTTTIVKTVDDLFSKMANSKDIGGIPHTPEEQAEFKQIFTDAVSINPETGYSRTRELFSDDEVLYKTLFLYNKIKEGDNSLRGFLSKFKEEYKQEILDKTRLAPRKTGGQYQQVAVPEPSDFE